MKKLEIEDQLVVWNGRFVSLNSLQIEVLKLISSREGQQVSQREILTITRKYKMHVIARSFVRGLRSAFIAVDPIFDEIEYKDGKVMWRKGATVTIYHATSPTPKE